MIDATPAYRAAITGDARRIFLKSVIDISDPDMIFGSVESSGFAPFARPEQLHNKVFSLDAKYTTLELNRWVLDGGSVFVPEDMQTIPGEVGAVSDEMSDESASTGSWIQLNFSNVSILQACSVFFPTPDTDGVPVDFSVDILQGNTVAYTQEFTGNRADRVSLSGFTVTNPTGIRVRAHSWSLPHRRMRVAEILPGVYESWGNDIIAEFDAKQQGDMSCLTLPYGTCTLRIDNADRRFEPRNKDGIFKSIEDRQGIVVSIGVELEDGSVEYKPIGTFYQHSGGWKTGDTGLTIQWTLVDIIGLLADRQFIPPATLPTTLEGWLQALTAQLGENFAGAYRVDEAYAAKAVSASSKDLVQNRTCGDILRLACMAAGTWPRADAVTGCLTAEPVWTEGNEITLDNLTQYPVVKANQDVAAIIFTLADGSGTQYVVPGNAPSSANTVSVDNPFIRTAQQANAAAALILSTYGGNSIEMTGRGDMSSEIGDMDTVELDRYGSALGRRVYQTFTFQDGVMQGCVSRLLSTESEGTR